MEDIVLIGGGGHCKSVIDVIESGGKYNIAGILEKTDDTTIDVLNYKVIGSDLDFDEIAKKIKYAIVTVGQIKSAELRAKLFLMAKTAGFLMPVIVSSRAYVSRHATIGEGTFIAHDVLINANVTIGRNCIINSKALIEHDSTIENNCHISTGALINGGVKIEDNCFLGSGAVTREGVVIIKDSFIKAGSLVK